MKAQDVKVGMEVLMKGIRSNINGRYRQYGTVTYVHERYRQAIVETPNGTTYHTGTADLSPFIREPRETIGELK